MLYRVVTLAKVYSGLITLTLCSLFNISCCWKIWMKSYSQMCFLIFLTWDLFPKVLFEFSCMKILDFIFQCILCITTMVLLLPAFASNILVYYNRVLFVLDFIAVF